MESNKYAILYVVGVVGDLVPRRKGLAGDDRGRVWFFEDYLPEESQLEVVHLDGDYPESEWDGVKIREVPIDVWGLHYDYRLGFDGKRWVVCGLPEPRAYWDPAVIAGRVYEDQQDDMEV